MSPHRLGKDSALNGLYYISNFSLRHSCVGTLTLALSSERERGYVNGGGMAGDVGFGYTFGVWLCLRWILKMNRFFQILAPIVLVCAGVVVLACGGDSEGVTAGASPEAMDSTRGSVATSAPSVAPTSTATPIPATRTATPAPEPTRGAVTAEVGGNVGDLAPEFTLNLGQGRRVTSAELVAQGKPVFILFHATW